MKKIASLVLILAVIIGNVAAQGDYEALLFSQSDYYGTARFMAAGGAFGATGGDFSAVSTNPASIGLYKRSEVTITPFSLSFGNSVSSYYGNESVTQKTKYTFPQCGIVFANKINRDNNWRAWQFGFGYNRLVDYNNTFRFAATTNNTLMNMVATDANGTNYQNLTGDGYLAWNNWLIDTMPGTQNQYFSPFSDEEYLEQKTLVKRSGSIDEMTFAFGGNYNDKLYIGATIGVPIIDYKEVTTISESPKFADHIYGIRDYTLSSEQKNSGAGINLKVGVIYQPVNFFRFGVGFHTPTYYHKIRDNFSRSLEASFFSGTTNTDSYSNYNRFTLSTPLKFNINASFIIMKRAFIAAEYEFQDYGMAKLYQDDYDYTFENDAIRNKFGVSHNLRVGGEINVTQGLAFRAGYRLRTSPYKDVNSEYDNTTHYISVGVGFRGQHFFGDLAYVYRINKDSYWIYDPVGEPGLYGTRNNSIIATLGYKF